MMVPTFLAALLAAGRIPWTRLHEAFADAEEQRRPLLLFFRYNCDSAHAPINPLAVGGPIEHQEGLSPCERMQEDVWENAAIVSAAERYLPVIVDNGDQTLQVRYQAVRMPTTLVTDPWGNEVFRTTGYLERDKMARILGAVPRDFAPLATAGRTLKTNPTDFGALVSAARFYGAPAFPVRPPVRHGPGRARQYGRRRARPSSAAAHPDGASTGRGGGALRGRALPGAGIGRAAPASSTPA